MEIVKHNAPRHHVLGLTLAGVDGRPILDHRAYARLAASLQAAAKDDDVKVVLLKGLAGCFCLGGDLSEFVDDAKHQPLIGAVTDLFRALATFPKPIIGCVDGDAVGVGCTVLFHCDLVFASRQSTYRVPFVDFGLVPDAATSILAPEKLGYAGAFRFFCMGEPLDGEAARALGLVSDLFDEDPEEAAWNAARQLARKPVNALAMTRSLLKGDTAELCRRIDREISLFHKALQDEATIRRLRKLSRRAA